MSALSLSTLLQIHTHILSGLLEKHSSGQNLFTTDLSSIFRTADIILAELNIKMWSTRNLRIRDVCERIAETILKNPECWMDEESRSFSTAYRFDVYICRKKKYIERNNDGSAVQRWAWGSTPFHASAQRCWGWGGGKVKMMQEWGFMHVQVKVYLGSVWGSSKGWVWLVRGRVRKWLQSHGRRGKKDRDGSEMQLREKKKRRRSREGKIWKKKKA